MIKGFAYFALITKILSLRGAVDFIPVSHELSVNNSKEVLINPEGGALLVGQDIVCLQLYIALIRAIKLETNNNKDNDNDYKRKN